jgi:hypothetical protein
MSYRCDTQNTKRPEIRFRVVLGDGVQEYASNKRQGAPVVNLSTQQRTYTLLQM